MTEIVSETYDILEVFDFDGVDHGYVVRKIGTEKLEDSNIWTDLEEVREHVTEANNRAMLAQFWPGSGDADVAALVNDPEFEPLEYKEEEVITDFEKLGEMIAAEAVTLILDEDTGAHTIHPDNIDAVREAGIITTEQVLTDPAAPMHRFQKAHEAVAWDRMKAALHASS